MMFLAGEPACPVACKYCFVTEHDARRELWNSKPRVGLNRATTFLNVPPWINEDPEEQNRFNEFPWHLLRGDFVGFTAVTDPMWPKLDKWLWSFIEHVAPLAKLVTCVTKWPVSPRQLHKLARVPNFRLVVSITGNGDIERVPVSTHLATLSLCRAIGVKAHPIVHPYIAGVSNLSFLPELRRLGYTEVDVKGFRYCEARMRSWMPESSHYVYRDRQDTEYLPDDGWRSQVQDAGMHLLSAREWYVEEGAAMSPHVPRGEAEEMVTELMGVAGVVSSSQDMVFQSAVERRL
jgi:DNA repair photolyase